MGEDNIPQNGKRKGSKSITPRSLHCPPVCKQCLQADRLRLHSDVETFNVELPIGTPNESLGSSIPDVTPM